MLTPGDLDIAARTVYGEARGEAYAGKKAVAHALVNRWKSTKGQFAKDDTLATACLRHLQVSCWTANDPNFLLIQTATVGDNVFRDCMAAVLEAIRENDNGIDPTQGSCHYHTLSVSPYWAKGKTPVVRIYNHAFYNDID